jgi:hypothetical protein
MSIDSEQFKRIDGSFQLPDKNLPTIETELSRRMRNRADNDKLPADHAMRTTAEAWDTASDGYFAVPQQVSTRAFVGAWARARRVWCDYTGEKLV